MQSLGDAWLKFGTLVALCLCALVCLIVAIGMLFAGNPGTAAWLLIACIALAVLAGYLRWRWR